MSEELNWGRSTVDTSCPLDCPDACSLDVSVEQGKVTRIDGSRRPTSPTASSAARSAASPVASTATTGCIPADPHRPEGQGRVPPGVVERGARRHRQPHRRGAHAQRRRGDPALLLRRLERPAHAGRRRRTLLPAPWRLAPGAHGLRGADRRRRAGLYGRCPASPTRTTRRALIVLWGVNPSASGIHLVPTARGAARGREAGRRRSAADPARQAGRPAPRGPAGHRPARRARLHRSCSRTASPTRRSSPTTRPARRAARRRRDVDDRRAAAVAGLQPYPRHFVGLYATTSPAVIRCGWGQERNRNGGARRWPSRAARGRRQVRRAGRRLHDEQLARGAERSRRNRRRCARDARREHEPARPRADEVQRPAGLGAVRLQLQPGGHAPDQNGCSRDSGGTICSRSCSSRS